MSLVKYFGHLGMVYDLRVYILTIFSEYDHNNKLNYYYITYNYIYANYRMLRYF